MNIQWLQTFIVAAEFENFRKTSEALFLSQPAVTKQIQRLEESLNIGLFDRVGKQIKLSEAGLRFLPHAKVVVENFDRGLIEFESWKQGYNRKLIIAVAPQIASSILPPLLRKFIDANPEIEVLIDVVTSYKVGEEVGAGRADIGLTRIQPMQVNVISEVIHEESVLLVGPAITEELITEEAAFGSYRLLTYNPPQYWGGLIKDIQKQYPHVRMMPVNQVEITKKFIEQGLGISFLPRTMVREEIAKKQLLQIPSMQIQLPTSITFLVKKVETKETELFREFLNKEIQSIDEVL